MLLYYASIAASIVHLDRPISELGPASLNRGLTWLSTQEWVTEEVRALLRQGLDHLRAHGEDEKLQHLRRESPDVEQVVTTLDDHDRLIAYVLGLSHAINIAFFTALAESGEAAPRLARLSSTTFDAQLAVASLVAGESPALYFEIQALNQYGGDSLAALVEAVTRLQSLVANQDAAGFARLMRRGQSYLQDRAAARQT